MPANKSKKTAEAQPAMSFHLSPELQAVAAAHLKQAAINKVAAAGLVGGICCNGAALQPGEAVEKPR